MEYYEHHPTNFLKDYIHKFWYVKGETGYKLEKILPMPYIFLIINLGEAYKLFKDKSLTESELKDGAWISGLRNEAIVIENPKEVCNIGIEFKPGGAYFFTEFLQEQLKDKVMDTYLVFDDDFISIQTKSKEGGTHTALFIELERTLEGLFRKKEVNSFEVTRNAIEAIIADNDVKISELAKKLAISTKHLNHLFSKYIGVTPKKLKDLYKFNNVIEEIGESRPKSWSEIAAKFNFHDQPHFNKVFKNYTNFTPNEYIKVLNKYGSGYLNFVALD